MGEEDAMTPDWLTVVFRIVCVGVLLILFLLLVHNLYMLEVEVHRQRQLARPAAVQYGELPLLSEHDWVDELRALPWVNNSQHDHRLRMLCKKYSVEADRTPAPGALIDKTWR